MPATPAISSFPSQQEPEDVNDKKQGRDTLVPSQHEPGDVNDQKERREEHKAFHNVRREIRDTLFVAEANGDTKLVEQVCNPPFSPPPSQHSLFSLYNPSLHCASAPFPLFCENFKNYLVPSQVTGNPHATYVQERAMQSRGR